MLPCLVVGGGSYEKGFNSYCLLITVFLIFPRAKNSEIRLKQEEYQHGCKTQIPFEEFQDPQFCNFHLTLQSFRKMTLGHEFGKSLIQIIDSKVQILDYNILVQESTLTCPFSSTKRPDQTYHGLQEASTEDIDRGTPEVINRTTFTYLCLDLKLKINERLIQLISFSEFTHSFFLKVLIFILFSSSKVS